MSDRKRVAHNAIYLFILTIFNYFISLLILPYISRVLTIEGFGLISFSMAYVIIFQVIVEFGFMISATALVSKNRNDRQKISEIVSSIMLAKILLAILSMFLFSLSVVFISEIRDNLLIVSLFLISSLLAAMIPDFYFRGIEKMQSITIRTVVIRLLSLLLIIVFVRNESQIVLIPVAFVIGNLLALIIAFYAITKSNIRIIRVHFKQAILYIKDGIWYFFSRVAVIINQSIGVFFIGLKYSPTSIEAGLFSGATRISLASEMILAPVSDSLYPHIVNKKDYPLLKKVVLIGGLVWFIVCLFIFVYAEKICTIILGEQYADSSDLLRILIFGNFMAIFSNLFGYNALEPIGKGIHANIALLVVAILNVFIYIILWLSDSITPVSVCIVMSSSNFVIFSYRGVALWINRRLIRLVQKRN